MTPGEKCFRCPSPARAIVGNHFCCSRCGMAEQRRIQLARVQFSFGNELKDGAYVRIIYKVGPRYPEAKRYGRIVESVLKMGPDDYEVGMTGHGPYVVFRIRLEDGTFETQHPEHLVLTAAPQLKAVS